MESSLTAAPFYALRGFQELSRDPHLLADGVPWHAFAWKRPCELQHQGAPTGAGVLSLSRVSGADAEGT